LGIRSAPALLPLIGFAGAAFFRMTSFAVAPVTVAKGKRHVPLPDEMEDGF
jgi:hypothetical protein